MLRILFSLLYVKYIFFSFYRSVAFEENIKYAKKDIASAMEFVACERRRISGCHLVPVGLGFSFFLVFNFACKCLKYLHVILV